MNRAARSADPKYDAIIIGGGIAGLGAAYALCRKKKKVLLIKPRKSIPGESTPASAGILDPFLESVSANHPYFKLKRTAFLKLPKQLKQVERLSGIKTGYQRTGMIFTAFTLAEEKALQARYQRHKPAGIPLQWIESAAAIKRWSYLSSAIRGVLYYPTLGRVFPRRLQRSLQKALKQLGGQTILSEGAVKVILKNKQVQGVKVGKRVISSSRVVNSCGSWADKSNLTPLRFPMDPIRGQVLVVKGAIRGLNEVVHSVGSTYVVPWEKGTVLLGATVEKQGFQSRVQAGTLKRIHQSAALLIPELAALKASESWAGLRPCSRDHLPLLGKTPLKGYYMATGYYRSGIVIGLHAGEKLADEIFSNKVSKELSPFSPMRFITQK